MHQQTLFLPGSSSSDPVPSCSTSVSVTSVSVTSVSVTITSVSVTSVTSSAAPVSELLDVCAPHARVHARWDLVDTQTISVLLSVPYLVTGVSGMSVGIRAGQWAHGSANF